MRRTEARPFARGDVARLLGIYGHNVGHYARSIARLKTDRRGTGNWRVYDTNDVLRFALVKDLIAVGFEVEEINGVFDAIEEPDPATGGKGWAWLRTAADGDGARLVIRGGHRLGPRRFIRAYLTTLDAATREVCAGSTLIVINVEALIAEIEQAIERERVIRIERAQAIRVEPFRRGPEAPGCK